MQTDNGATWDGSCVAWWEADRSRLDFLRRLLRALVAGPLTGSFQTALSLFRLESFAARMDSSDAKDAAKQILAERQGECLLWAAYAQAEAEAGRLKVSRPSASESLGHYLSLMSWWCVNT